MGSVYHRAPLDAHQLPLERRGHYDLAAAPDIKVHLAARPQLSFYIDAGLDGVGQAAQQGMVVSGVEVPPAAVGRCETEHMPGAVQDALAVTGGANDGVRGLMGRYARGERAGARPPRAGGGEARGR